MHTISKKNRLAGDDLRHARADGSAESSESECEPPARSPLEVGATPLSTAFPQRLNYGIALVTTDSSAFILGIFIIIGLVMCRDLLI